MHLSVVSLFLFAIIIKCSAVQVETEYGPVIGYKLSTIDKGVSYEAFSGIPYAKPPVGDLRFRAPLPPNKWSQPYNATKEKLPCMQTGVNCSEDCLYLNIYTPSTESSKKYPVMFWIHGGYFATGDPARKNFGPDFFIDEDVILVTFAYRLGILGFLSTADEVAPGNFALKDQILALKWVKNNIANFGGDPDRITIFGQSSGAACVGYLLITDKTKGLFNRAIVQSGTAIAPFALVTDPKKNAVIVAAANGIISKNSTEIIEGLRKVDAQKLASIGLAQDVGQSILRNILDGLIWAPNIEINSDEAVVTGYNYMKLINVDFNQVPIIIGATSQEAGFFFDEVTALQPYFARYDVVPTRLIRSNMNISDNSHQLRTTDLKSIFSEEFDQCSQLFFRLYDDKLKAAKLTQCRYWGNSLIVACKMCIIQFMSDDQFVFPVYEHALAASQYTDVYFYIFSFEGDLPFMQKRQYEGVPHADDLYYLFNSNDANQSYYKEGSSMLATRQRMISLWTNFAKSGNPTPSTNGIIKTQWPKVQGSSIQYLDIGKEVTVKEEPLNKNMSFLRNLYKTFAELPIYTV